MIDTPQTLAALPMFDGVTVWNPKKGKPPRKAVFDAWFGAFGRECPECGCEMKDYAHVAVKQRAMDQITIDHKLARAIGGTYALDNLTCICRRCNYVKGRRESWIALADRASSAD